MTTATVPRLAPDDLQGAAAALAEHGACVVADLIPPRLVDALRADVRRETGVDALAPCESRYVVDFAERSAACWEMLGHAPYLAAVRALVGAHELTLTRSAAIARAPGNGGCGWHSDRGPGDGPARTVDDVLNRGGWPNGLWSYLDGCHPVRGGLAVVPGSQVEGWRPAAGWRLDDAGRAIVRADGAPAPMDVPGAVSIVADPGDLVVFASRTFHAAHPHRASTPRLSAGLALRPRAARIDAPWPLPASARAFLSGAPPHVRPFLDGYTGIAPGWTA